MTRRSVRVRLATPQVGEALCYWEDCILDQISGSGSLKPGSTNGNTSPLKIRLATSGVTKIAIVSYIDQSCIYGIEILLYIIEIIENGAPGGLGVGGLGHFGGVGW
jgi:hypothetical protein